LQFGCASEMNLSAQPLHLAPRLGYHPASFSADSVEVDS
jgi:hypothetical protein